jgi:polyhydroxyalkanoate synthesis regulator phasin
MDQNQMFKQMIEFNKTTFDNSLNAIAMLQEQTEKMFNSMLDQATWLPKEGRKAIDDWMTAYKDGFKNFKKTADDNFKKVEDYFKSTQK